ncbi:MAG: hypothetical protein KBS67_05060 [Bacteroidales bacterium]|nr:hypothetical protein [Candidatus Cryptobacteroides equifaecalis]
MKRFIFMAIAMLALLTVPAKAQKTDVFKITTGKKSMDVKYSYSKHDGLTRLSFTINGDTTVQDMNGSFQTVYWKISKPAQNTEVSVVVENGKYHMTGKIKGEAVDKLIDSGGYPWYQHIGIAAGKNVPQGGKITFGCFRPDQLDFYTMTAEDKGTEAIGPFSNAQRIKVTPTGRFAKLWSCDYYLDPQTKEYIAYKAVEGPPGTALTTWIRQ